MEVFGPFRSGAHTSAANGLLSILAAGLMGGVAIALSLRREVR